MQARRQQQRFIIIVLAKGIRPGRARPQSPRGGGPFRQGLVAPFHLQYVVLPGGPGIPGEDVGRGRGFPREHHRRSARPERKDGTEILLQDELLHLASQLGSGVKDNVEDGTNETSKETTRWWRREHRGGTVRSGAPNRGRSKPA